MPVCQKTTRRRKKEEEKKKEKKGRKKEAKKHFVTSGSSRCNSRVIMSSIAVKQPSKNPTKSSSGPGGGNVPSGPALPLASPLMGKKKKPFLGMPAPLGYVPGLGRG